MSKVTAEEFVELVAKSELVEMGDIRRVVASLTDALTGKMPEDVEQVSNAFVENELITAWQAGMLLRGKHKGFRLGKYLLRDHLGTGGMSRVYLAQHVVMRRLVAIKVLPQNRVSDSSYLGRFMREAEMAAQLDHRNIVRAFDVDHEGQTYYIVMEYINGEDFLQIVKKGHPLPYRRVADFVAQAADGLQHAHDAGLVHRDVKPANCLVDRHQTVKLLDLGLAKFSEDDGPSLTIMHDENVLGTADYLAPEQAINSHNVDYRADIYGLGCTFYFMLTGKPPFPEGTLPQRLVKHQREEPPSIRETRADVPKELSRICRQMMAKNPDGRIQHCRDVSRRLRDWLQGPHSSASAIMGAEELELALQPAVEQRKSADVAPVGSKRPSTSSTKVEAGTLSASTGAGAGKTTPNRTTTRQQFPVNRMSPPTQEPPRNPLPEVKLEQLPELDVEGHGAHFTPETMLPRYQQPGNRTSGQLVGWSLVILAGLVVVIIAAQLLT